MSSVLERALGASGSVTSDAEEFSARILDAAHDLFCRMGIQKTTVDDVARAAGVSRITVYRRFATKDVLIEHVVRRELQRYFAQFLEDIKAAETVADRVVTGFVSSLRAVRRNALIAGLLAAEPSARVPSLIASDGENLATVRGFVAGQLRREQAAGNVSDALDVDLVAEMMVRLSTSFLVSPSRIVDVDDDEQLTAVARQFLVPMLQPV